MNREQSQKIITTLRLNFENFHPNLSSEELTLLINQWEFQFKNEDYPTVYTAIQRYISTNRYAPKIADIKSIIYDMKNKGDLPSEEEAWSLVLRAGRNSLYNVSSEIKALPQYLQDIISRDFLRSIATSSNEGLVYIKKDFLEKFSRLQESHKRDVQISSISHNTKLLENGKDEQKALLSHKEDKEDENKKQ